MKKLLCVLLAALLCGALAACSGASGGEKGNGAYDSGLYDSDAVLEETPTNEGTGLQVKESERKLIYTSEISAETKDFDTARSDVDALISKYDAYLESSSFSGYSRGDEQTDRSLDYTIRIPSEALSEFLGELENTVRVTSSNTYMEDVTGNYVDTQSRLNALKQEEAWLLELVEAAENLEELLQLEDRLSSVRYEIESMTSQLQIYDDEIAYSTVNLSLRDVTEYTIRPSFGSRSWEAFTGGWSSFINALQGIVIALLWLLPFLLIGGVIVFLAVFFTRRTRRRRRERFPVPPAGPAPMGPVSVGPVPTGSAPAFTPSPKTGQPAAQPPREEQKEKK